MSEIEMKEIEFIEGIDSCFPYKNEDECIKLIQKAADISSNASFMVLYEICMGSDKISRSSFEKLLSNWEASISHPLKNILLNIGQTFIGGETISSKELIKIMEQIAEYSGQYNALNLAYSLSENGDIKNTYNQIVEKWKGAL